MGIIIRDYSTMTLEEMHKINLEEDDACIKSLIQCASGYLKEYDILCDRILDKKYEDKKNEYIDKSLLHITWYKEIMNDIYELEKMKRGE